MPSPTPIEVLAIDRAELDYILNMDHELGYKLLWRFTETLSMHLRETNEKMADFLALSVGFQFFPLSAPAPSGIVSSLQ